MKNLFIIKAKCAECKKDFYIRYDKSVNEKWVMTYGEKNKPAGDSGNSGDMQIDAWAAYTGPQYSCPWCGRRGWMRCGACKQFYCFDAKIDGNHYHCPHCDKSGERKRSGKSSGKSTLVIDGSGGTGQG